MAHRQPFNNFDILPDHIQNIREGRFLRLEKRGWTHPFHISGELKRKVTILVPKGAGAATITERKKRKTKSGGY